MTSAARRGFVGIRTKRRVVGFTLIELMAAVAVVAILATLALPSVRAQLVRGQIVDAMKIAEIAKAPIAAAWGAAHTLPADNAAAGLPPADKIVGNFVTSVLVEAGAIHVTFGNKANPAIAGQTLTLRPAVVEDAAVVPIAWLCGHAAAVDKMVAKGVDRTTVEARLLPINCRAGG
jgi:type IV pilus assembly protein PilA